MTLEETMQKIRPVDVAAMESHDGTDLENH
mgnify:CR=1 FL=1